MSTSSAPKRKPAYDPSRQWGLKPADADSGGGSTYIVSGHIVSGSKWDPKSVHATENIGREGQAKAKRKMSGKDGDRALMNLLERDKEGMKAVMKAREVGKPEGSNRNGKTGSKGKTERQGGQSVSEDGTAEEDEQVKDVVTARGGYSAQVIKQLGFDPIVKAGQHRDRTDLDMQKKVSFGV